MQQYLSTNEPAINETVQRHGFSTNAVLSMLQSVADGSGDWWPDGLPRPDSTGAQNGVRYAYFGQARRLAIETGGRVMLYDTQDHRISGFSQQSPGATSSFTSQHGVVNVARLPVVSGGAAA